MKTPPPVSPALRRWFVWYARRYLRRHFHAVRVLREAPAPAVENGPAIFFLNHASWWDPLTAILLSQRYYANLSAFAPMDEKALRKYAFMSRLGFFPVERGTPRGARQFLESAGAILASPGNALWLTPQGFFTDARARPVRLEPGLDHLAKRFPEMVRVPVAIEYTWWFERSPEILVAFGKSDAPPAPALEAAQDRLAAAAMERREDAFETILSGRAGVGGIYDGWRKLRARLAGGRFDAHHHYRPPR